MPAALEPQDLANHIAAAIRKLVAEAGMTTGYHEPLVGFADASDPRFANLRRVASPTHLLPQDLLPGARSVVSFFLPFAPWVLKANAADRLTVAREWAVAYVETNALIGRINAHLVHVLRQRGINAAAEPATHNFDKVTLVSHWSHKSVAVIAGLGSFGLHQMVITDAGCAGRFGSLVLDVELPFSPAAPREHCLYFQDESCLECVMRCPVSALDPNQPFDRQSCWQRCQDVANVFSEIGLADVCGKCAIGPCSFESATL